LLARYERACHAEAQRYIKVASGRAADESHDWADQAEVA
jgi:hypothetical protein